MSTAPVIRVRRDKIDEALHEELDANDLTVEEFVRLAERDELPTERLRTLWTFVGSDLRDDE